MPPQRQLFLLRRPNKEKILNAHLRMPSLYKWILFLEILPSPTTLQLTQLFIKIEQLCMLLTSLLRILLFRLHLNVRQDLKYPFTSLCPRNIKALYPLYYPTFIYASKPTPSISPSLRWRRRALCFLGNRCVPDLMDSFETTFTAYQFSQSKYATFVKLWVR